MRGLSWWLVSLGLAVVGCVPRVDDCWSGLALGEHIELRVVDVYVEGGPYTWTPLASPDLPSCAGRDGLDVGARVEMELVGSNGVAGCRAYIARPLAGVTGPDFSGTLRGGGGAVFATETGYCGGFWELYGLRLEEQGPSPLGETAMAGRLPPVIVQRTISGDCDCIDTYVGEVQLVGSADAGGPDAGR